jgi:hypothetical protein
MLQGGKTGLEEEEEEEEEEPVNNFEGTVNLEEKEILTNVKAANPSRK